MLCLLFICVHAKYANALTPPVFQIAVDQAEIESALLQLSEWGNLEAVPDTGDVATVEDFYKQRYLFQLTNEGEAAQRALESFDVRSDLTGELRRSDLADIRNVLRELTRLSLSVELHSDEVHRYLLTLQARFESLVDSAQRFMGELQRKIDWQGADDADSISGKQRVIDYLQRFIGELVIATDDIAQAVRDIENAGIERLLQAAAERTVVDEMDPGPEKLSRALSQWRSRVESVSRLVYFAAGLFIQFRRPSRTGPRIDAGLAQQHYMHQ